MHTLTTVEKPLYDELCAVGFDHETAMSYARTIAASCTVKLDSAALRSGSLATTLGDMTQPIIRELGNAKKADQPIDLHTMLRAKGIEPSTPADVRHRVARECASRRQNMHA
jgi:hypothetical protein